MTGALTTREEEGEGGAIRREAAPRRLAPSVEDGGLPGWAYLQASLPVVDNNRKVVGALSVVGEKFSKILAKFVIFSDILNTKFGFVQFSEKCCILGKSRKILVKI